MFPLVIRKSINKIPNKNKIVYILLSLIICLGAAVRVHNFKHIYNWDGESARDILVAKHMVVFGGNKLVAPMVSDDTGLLQNSALYFNFIALLWLLTPSPLGVTSWFALFGIANIVIAYGIGKVAWSREAGLISALLVSVFGFFIRQSQMVWQPHLVPFFSGLAILFLLLGVNKNKLWLFAATATAFISVQMHYSSLPLMPVIAGVSLAVFIKDTWLKPHKKNIIYTVGYVVFLLLNILVWVALTNSQNPNSLFDFFSQLLVSLTQLQSLLPRVLENYTLLFQVFSGNSNLAVNQLLFASVCLGIVWLLKTKNTSSNNFPRHTILFLLFLSGALTALNTHVTITDYYLTPYYLLLITVISVIISAIPKHFILLKAILLIAIVMQLFSSAPKYTIFMKDSYQLLEQAATQIDSDYGDLAITDPEISNSSFNANLYVYTLHSVEAPFYDTSLLWYPLEEIRDQQLITVRTQDNNVLPQSQNNKVGYVTCVNLYLNHQIPNWILNCPQMIQDFFVNQNLDLANLTITPLSTNSPEYTLYRIESLVELPFE